MIRIGQLALVLAAVMLWLASQLTWVELRSFDGLGQPRTTELSGGSWSTALLPLALLVLAAAVAALAVRGWPLRLLAALVAVASLGTAYLGISLWVMRDVAVRAADLADVPVAELVGSQRHYGGAALALVAAFCALLGAVLLLRSAVRGTSTETKYTPRKARRAVTPGNEPAGELSERMIWDALDGGHDPTDPDNRGG